MEITAILHNIRSLYNVGSIFRIADAAGVKKIYLGGITPSPLDRFGKLRPQFAKVSLGAEKSVAWEKVKTASELIVRLKREDYKILALEQNKKSILYNSYEVGLRKNCKICLVVGNEVKGLPPLILEKADKILEIPMRGKKESLNVGVAFGIVVYNLIF